MSNSQVKSYSAEFKDRAVKLAVEFSYHQGSDLAVRDGLLYAVKNGTLKGGAAFDILGRGDAGQFNFVAPQPTGDLGFLAVNLLIFGRHPAVTKDHGGLPGFCSNTCQIGNLEYALFCRCKGRRPQSLLRFHGADKKL